jgi:hypothetical protein
MSQDNNQVKNSVICATCKKENTNLFSVETEQAYGCSTELIEKEGKIFSYSHYGSKFDTLKFNFTDLAHFKLGNMCDDCLEKAINSSIATEDKNFCYFDPY